mgnify:CR=1 FL=1
MRPPSIGMQINYAAAVMVFHGGMQLVEHIGTILGLVPEREHNIYILTQVNILLEKYHRERDVMVRQ